MMTPFRQPQECGQEVGNEDSQAWGERKCKWPQLGTPLEDLTKQSYRSHLQGCSWASLGSLLLGGLPPKILNEEVR